MSERLTLHVPLPPRQLSPNGRVDYRRVGAVKATYKAEVEAIAFTARRDCLWMPPERARISLHYGIKGCVKAGRYGPRDWDNAVAVFKTAQDALVAAGVLRADDRAHLEGGSVTFDLKNGPWVRVTLEAL